MSDPTFDVNIYPQEGPNPAIINSDPNRAALGVCFSGGGSRALTCAWGQMIGLRSLSSGEVSLLDKVRYISSVSGGSWASVLYTYLPDSIPDDEFLPAFFEPQNLRLNSAPSGTMDVSQMGANAMGQVPQKFANLFDPDPFDNIIASFINIVLLKQLDLSDSLKWLWMYIVGNDVLAPFGLYTYEFSFLRSGVPWNYVGAKSFSLSQAYGNEHIFNLPQHPDTSNFVYVRTDSQGNVCRPMLIVNTNIVGADAPDAETMGPIQIPVHVTPVSGGSFGSNPVVPNDIVGGGSVESFGFTSQLQSPQTSQEEVVADFPRDYSLVDITSCSSAFFAAILAQSVPGVINTMMAMDDDNLTDFVGNLLDGERSLLPSATRQRLAALQKEGRSLDLSDLVPQYNYWPVSKASAGSAANKLTQFTDGGDLENTGVLGMLAQTDVSKIIAFVNTCVELEKTSDDVIVAVAQASPLFGIAFDSRSKQFKPYEAGGVNPFTGKVDPMGFLTVFDNSADQFGALREALYQANGSAGQTAPAFHQQSLNVIGNKLAGVPMRDDPVTVLWVQNARVNDWQTKITDEPLSTAIAKGQSDGGLADFAGFPYYDTFTKIHQTPAETNTLAQLWAWCIASEESPLRAAIEKLF